MLWGCTQHLDILGMWLLGGTLSRWGSWPLGVQEAEVRSQASVFDRRWLDPDGRLGRKSRLALCLS